MKTLFFEGYTSNTVPKEPVSLSITPTPYLQLSLNQQANTNTQVQWFPMRVTYHRETRIKALLDEMGIENFLPMHWVLVETKNGGKKRMLLLT